MSARASCRSQPELNALSWISDQPVLNRSPSSVTVTSHRSRGALQTVCASHTHNVDGWSTLCAWRHAVVATKLSTIGRPTPLSPSHLFRPFPAQAWLAASSSALPNHLSETPPPADRHAISGVSSYPSRAVCPVCATPAALCLSGVRKTPCPAHTVPMCHVTSCVPGTQGLVAQTVGP